MFIDPLLYIIVIEVYKTNEWKPTAATAWLTSILSIQVTYEWACCIPSIVSFYNIKIKQYCPAGTAYIDIWSLVQFLVDFSRLVFTLFIDINKAKQNLPLFM